MTLETKKELTVVLIAEDGTIVDAHASCKESFGWNREDLPGKDIGELLSAERGLLMAQVLQLADSLEAVDEQTSFSMRIVALRKDQTSFPARVVVRRFTQMDCWTVGFYPITPYDEVDIAPIFPTPDMGSSLRADSPEPHPTGAKPIPVPAKTPPMWSNSRLLTSSGRAAATSVPSQRPIPKQQPQFEVPQNIFKRKPSPEQDPVEEIPVPKPEAVRESQPMQETATLPKPEPLPVEKPEPIEGIHLFEEETPEVNPNLRAAEASVDEVSTPIVPGPISTEQRAATDQLGLSVELESERAERRQLEQRIAFLTSQVGSLHLELSEHLEEQGRTQRKVGALESELNDTRKLLEQAQAELTAEKENGPSQGDLDALQGLNKQLEEQVSGYKAAHEALQRAQVEAESQLQSVNADLKKCRGTLAEETTRRQELEQKLASVDLDRSDYERKTKLELCKLESALKARELELKQLEVERAQQALQSKA